MQTEDFNGLVQYHRQSNNCFQDVLGMILVNNGLNPQNIYLGSLNFGYNQDRKLFGERITPSRDGNWLDCTVFESLADSVGMVVEKKENRSFHDLSSDFTNSRSGLILELDVFDCSWHEFYGKVHSYHYCWLVNIEHDEFVIMLPFGEKKGTYDFSKDKSFNYYTIDFSMDGNKPAVSTILKNTYDNCLLGYNGKCDLDQMRSLRNDVNENGIDLGAEREGFSDIVTIPFIRALEWVLWGRMNYRDLLSDNNTNGECDSVIAELDKLIETWKGIKNFAIIEFMRNHQMLKEGFASYLDEMINQEETVLKTIKATLTIE